MPGACINCAATIEPEARFCGRCGQDHRHVRLQLIDLLRDALTELSAFDRPWIRTVRALIPEAGTFARRYVKGKRVDFVSPLRFLVVAVAFAGLTTELAAWMLSTPTSPGMRWMPIVMLVCGPALAYVLRFFCAAWIDDPAEVMVLAFYLMGAIALAQAVVNLLAQLLPMYFGLALFLLFIMVLAPIYLGLSFARFFTLPLWRGLVVAYLIGYLGAISIRSLVIYLGDSTL